jgi:CheY-like chemotaxis protein
MSYILLVEDNKENAEMTIRILESANYRVKHVINGLESTPAVRHEKPALILMDFDLPDVNGRTMVLVLKKLAPTVPVVAVTARTGEAEMRIAKGFGCSAFISKPFDPQHLLTVVGKFVPAPAASPPPTPAP